MLPSILILFHSFLVRLRESLFINIRLSVHVCLCVWQALSEEHQKMIQEMPVEEQAVIH